MAYIGAILYALLILFLNLGSEGIYAAQEGRTALIVRNMLLSGNYLDMCVDHGIPYEKPIGHYWLCLLPAHIGDLAGDPLDSRAELMLRLPSALSALFLAILTGILAARIYQSSRTGAITIIVLSSMATFATLGRLAHIDMPLAAAFGAAMFFLYIGYWEQRSCNRWIYGFYLALGWGLLLKGPVVIVLAGLIVTVLAFCAGNIRMLWELRPLTGGLLLLVVALPWYVVENVRTEGAFFQEFIVNQNLRRFTGIGSTYRDGERMSNFYYFPKMFAGMLPWSIFTAAGIMVYIHKLLTGPLHWPRASRNHAGCVNDYAKKWLAFRPNWRPGTVFLLVWFGVGLVFFSFSALKRGDYVLLLYPAGAILTARMIDRFLVVAPNLGRYWIRWWWAVVVLLGVAAGVNFSGFLITIGSKNAMREWNFMSRRDGMTMAMISEYINQNWYWALVAAGVILALLWLLGFFLSHGRRSAALVLLAAVVLLIFSLYHCVIQPGTDRNKTVKPFVRQARGWLPPEQKVLYIGDFNTELIFFMNRPYDVKMDDHAPFVICGERVLKRFLDTGDWEILVQTGAQHQYPAALLQRKPAL